MMRFRLVSLLFPVLLLFACSGEDVPTTAGNSEAHAIKEDITANSEHETGSGMDTNSGSIVEWAPTDAHGAGGADEKAPELYAPGPVGELTGGNRYKVKGVIKSIDTDRAGLVLSGEAFDSARIVANGKLLKRFKTGEKVSVRYDFEEGRMVAYRINKVGKIALPVGCGSP